MPEKTKKIVEIERPEPLELNKQGQVTIPEYIREKYGINPSDGKTIWVEINIEEAEIRHDSMEGSA